LLVRLVPVLDWLVHYQSKHLPGDVLAGVIVATLLIPQAMACALLAGLPAQVGFYAGLPLAVYALLGTAVAIPVGRAIRSAVAAHRDSGRRIS
jgi:sulfate permease, SulP family